MNNEQLLVEYLGSIPDYRENHNKRHLLVDILVMTVIGLLSGANGFTDIVEVCRGKETYLRTFLALPNGIPSHDTFNRVVACIDTTTFEASFFAWAAATFPDAHQPQQYALDGKELHYSHNPRDTWANLRVVSVWAIESGIVLGHRMVDDESNEIGTVQQVLNTLHIDGCDITLDALHCQKETAKQVIQGNGDYTIIVKSNQKNSIKTFARHLHISKRHMIHRSMCMKRSKKTMVELNGVV